jgi:hypothetical protein
MGFLVGTLAFDYFGSNARGFGLDLAITWVD